jgi:hypothetical protein
MAGAPPPAQQIQIQAEWLDPNEVTTYYANFCAVIPIKDEFVLTFGVGVPPIIAKPLTPDQVKQLKFQIKPVVRIGMTPGHLIELLQLIQTQLNLYNQTLKQDPN